MFSDPLWRRVTTQVTASLLGMTIAADTPELRGMARLVRSWHALDVYLAQGPVVTMAMQGLQVGRVRLVVTVAGQAPIALTDDALMARATRHGYAALGLHPQERTDPTVA